MLGTLTQKVTLIAAIFLGLFVLAAALVLVNIISIRDAAQHVGANTAEQLELSGEFNTDMFRGFAEALSFADTRAPENRHSALQEMSDAKAILDQLAALVTTPDPYAPDLFASQAQLQARRAAVYNGMQPKIANLLQAVDAGDTAAIDQALEALNAYKSEIEGLEEHSGTLADSAIAAAISSVATRVQIAFISLATFFVLAVVLVLIVLGLMRRWLVRPITQLAGAAGAVAQGDLGQSVAVTSGDELGTLQRGFNRMVANVASARAEVTKHQAALEAQLAELTQALTELRASTRAREQLQTAIRELSSPVVPILDGIVVMPLIGVIDTERATQLTQALLSAAERYRAVMVILDVTGVPLIDTQVARVLLTAAQAVRLLGAQTILVGLRPELAQTIVGLNLNLTGLRTEADLQSAVEYVLLQRRPRDGRLN